MEKAYGIPLLSKLAAKNQDFQGEIQVRQPDIPSAINRWLSASNDPNKIRPTWAGLSSVLHRLDLDPLAQQMEAYLMDQTICKFSYGLQ